MGQVIVRIGADVQVGEIELTYETAELSGTVRLDDDLCPAEDTEVFIINKSNNGCHGQQKGGKK